jgi:endo-1,4-beta-mannosidase
VPEIADRTYAGMRGFNYVPSYAATIWDVFDDFDAAVWDRELGYAKRFDATALRVWCDHLSFQRDEERFLASWRRALELAERHQLRLMPTLANRWADAAFQFGQLEYVTVLAGEPSAEYRRYLETLVGAFRDDPRVLMWDLCNEPFFPIRNVATGPDSTFEPPAEPLQRAELSFWRGVAETVRGAGASQPVTIGVHAVPGCTPDEVHELVDVLSCHPYAGWWDGGEEFARTCDAYVELANRLGKPLIATETCQGSMDDETRSRIVAASLRALEQRGIGWLAWQLMAGQVVTARRDRTDRNCRPGDRSVMYFVERDGTTRPGHDVADWRDW